jgi:hypothetical protein
LEVLLLVPPGPHPGQFAEGKRVAADDVKFAIDEIDICYPSLKGDYLHPSETTPRYRGYRKNRRLAITIVGIFPIALILTAVSIVLALDGSPSRLTLPPTGKFSILRVAVMSAKRGSRNVQLA